MPLNSWALLSLIATLTNLIVLVFVLLQNPRSVVNRTWALAIFCLILWGSGQFILRIISDYATAEMVQRISGVGFCLLPSPFLHFAMVFTQPVSLRGWIYPVIYAPGIVFSILALEGYITKANYFPWGFSSDPHTGYWIYILWLEIYFLWGLYLCYCKWKKSRLQRERYQALFVIFGVTVPLLLGSVIDVLLPRLGFAIPRISVAATTVTAAFISYAIIKFQLMSLTPQTTAGTILDTIVDLLAVTDLDGHVVFSNEAFRRMLAHHGKRREPLNITDFVEGGSEILHAAENLQVPKAQSQLLDVHYKTLQGSSFPVLLSISPIFDRGETVGFALLARDMTERKQAEEALKESEERYRTVVETVTDAIIMIDEDSKILSINTAAEKIFGYSIAEMLEQDLTMLMPEEVRPRHKAAVQRYLATAEKRFAWNSIELPGLHKNGNIIPLEISFGEFIKDGKHIFTGIIRDITERKMLRQQLDEIARQRTEDLRRFATSVQRAQEEERRRIARELHDDLGQRLTGMKLHLEVFEDDIPQTNKKTIKRLEEVKSQIDVMITEIRRVSSNLRPTTLDDFGLVVALQLLCKEFQKAHNLKVKFQPAVRERYDEPVEIALYRIAQEALSNIVKHAAAASVLVHLSDSGNALALIVQDDGKGVDAGKIQLQKGSRRGLGLISMRERAENLGGSFRLESAPHGGAIIRVVIPISAAKDYEEDQNIDR